MGRGPHQGRRWSVAECPAHGVVPAGYSGCPVLISPSESCGLWLSDVFDVVDAKALEALAKRLK